MTRLLPALLTLALTGTLSTAALAHDDATLDARATPHGGQQRMAGPYHFELVLGENSVDVYLTDHADATVQSDGVSGQVVLLGEGRATIDLTPAGENRLRGEGAFTPGPEPKAVVSLTFPDGQTWQARFTPGTASGAGTETGAAADPAAADPHAHQH